MAKTNIEQLRELVSNNIESTHKAEIIRLINAAGNELRKKEEEIEELETEEQKEPSYENSSFVGLDTINWSLEKGNINIQMKVEGLISELQKQNCASAAWS